MINGAKAGGANPELRTCARALPLSAAETAMGTTDRSKFIRESAAGATGIGLAVLPAASAGRLTSGVNSATMIRPNRILRKCSTQSLTCAAGAALRRRLRAPSGRCYRGFRVFPKLFQYGDFFLPTYGVLVALAFLAGLWVTTRLARRAGINHELVVNLVVYCALAGLLGAKLLMFIFDWDHFSKNPADMFSIATLRAAGVYQGGLILAVATAFWYVRRHGMPWLQTFDVFAPGIAIGHAIGKVGCFAAGCCWGKECDLPWAVTFRNPDANALTGRAVARAAASCATLRNGRRGAAVRISLLAIRPCAPPGNHHRPVL